MPLSRQRRLVLALVAQNENQTLQHASEGLGIFFAQHGYRQQAINLFDAAGGQQLLAALQSGEVAFVYGFAGVGAQLTQNGKSLWTLARTPFISFWYDHPAYNYRQHIVASPYILNCYHVEDHWRARIDYLPPVNSSIFIPPPWGLNPWAKNAAWPFRQRVFMFAKTAYDPQQLMAAWQDYPPPLRDLLHQLVEQAKRDRNLDITAAAAQGMQAIGMARDNLDAFMGIIYEIDHYIRHWRSDRIVRALAHYPTDLYGRGWDYLQGLSRHVTIQPAFHNLFLLGQLADYRLIVNTNPLWRHGIHERTMMGIASGCVTLTDRSERSEQLLCDQPHYIGFEWDDRLDDAVARAWEASRDGVDYRASGAEFAARHAYNAENFLKPLLHGIDVMLDQAEATLAN